MIKRKFIFSVAALVSLLSSHSVSFAEGCGKEEIKVPVYCERTVVVEPAKMVCSRTDSNFADFSEGCALTDPVTANEKYVCGTKSQWITKMCPHG